MRPVYLTLAACTLALGALGELKVIANSRVNSTITAISRLGEIILPTRHLRANAEPAASAASRYGLTIILDPSTGCFQWLLGVVAVDVPGGLFDRVIQSKELVAYSSPNGVIVFFLAPGRLDILDSPDEARNMEDAEAKALREAARAPSGEAGGVSPRWRTVSLATIEDAFWRQPNYAKVGPLKILGVTQEDETWNITIEGQWKEKVVLTRKFVLVKSERAE